MAHFNPRNERIKRDYFAFLKDAKGQSEATVDAVAKALARFEADTKYRDFKAFHHEQAIAFKRRLALQDSKVTGGKLSKATQHATLACLKAFFQWLSMQQGFRSHIKFTDADYFNASEKDARIATARRQRPAPTLEQVEHALNAMPTATDIDLRNRALVAFTLLTGARDTAIASMKLKHVDPVAGCVHQDAREVRTKFSKTFTTYFFPVGDGPRQIVLDWIDHLRRSRLWGNDDPLFPTTQVAVGGAAHFEAVGLARAHWQTASPIRAVFRQAFERAGLTYFNPHSFRHTLVELGERLCRSPEEFKAWSQNLGHEGVLTTFCSYGTVSARRQAELIGGLALARDSDTPGFDDALVAQVIRRLRR